MKKYYRTKNMSLEAASQFPEKSDQIKLTPIENPVFKQLSWSCWYPEVLYYIMFPTFFNMTCPIYFPSLSQYSLSYTVSSLCIKIPMRIAAPIPQ